jgi:hypothetical protein
MPPTRYTPEEKPPGYSDQASPRQEVAQSMTDTEDRGEGKERQREDEIASGMTSPDANAYDPLPLPLSPTLEPQPRQIVDIEFVSLQFFESGQETIPRAQRKYSANFPQSSARFIYFELTLRNHNRQREQVYQVTYRYTIDGQLQWENQDEYIVRPDWTRCWFSRGCGKADPRCWEPGEYRVEIFIDGVPFTEGSFILEEDTPSLEFKSLLFFESGKDVPTKDMRQYNTSFPQDTTRYINFELCLNNLYYGWVQRHGIQLAVRYYNPDGSLLWEGKRKLVLTYRDKFFVFTLGWGNEQPAYTPGGYGVEILINGETFTKGSFTIEADTRQEAHTPGSMKISTTPAYAFDSLRFFESGTTRDEYEHRKYNTRFAQSSTRYIYYELGMSRIARIQKAIPYQVEDRYYKPDGSLMTANHYEEQLQSGWGSWRSVSARGWDDPGHWEQGTYRVEILIDGVLFAERSFSIEEDKAMEQTESRLGVELKHLKFYVGNLTPKEKLRSIYSSL